MRARDMRPHRRRCGPPSAPDFRIRADVGHVDFLPVSSGVRHTRYFIPCVSIIADNTILWPQPVVLRFSLCCSNFNNHIHANICPVAASACARCWGERCSLRTAMLPPRGWFEMAPNQTPAQRRAGRVGSSAASVLRISAADGHLVAIRPKRVAPNRRIS